MKFYLCYTDERMEVCIMKKKILSFILILSMALSVVFVMPISVSAATEYKSGYYTYTVTNGVASIVGVDESIGGNVVIPSRLGEFDVETIASFAFYRCSNINSITIPDTIVTIEEYAFAYCERIDILEIPDSVREIGQYAFYRCEGLTSVSIGDSVVSIPKYCFSNCINLKEIIIGLNVEEISSGAFSSCVNLNAIEWGNKIETIGDYAFKDCLALKNVVFPVTNTRLGESSFQNCEKLELVLLPNKIKNIGRSAFAYCKSLKSIIIPDSISNLGSYAFYKCAGLTSVEIGSGVEVVPQFCFAGCNNLITVKIGSNVKKFEHSAFGSCTNLNTIKWGNKLEIIGEHAFDGCVNLETVILPNTIVTVCSRAFFQCEGIEVLAIPDSVESIRQYAFYGCDNISSLYLSKNVDDIGGYAFCTCDKLNDLYYSGTQYDWNNLKINNGNEPIFDATIHYNSTIPEVPTEPTLKSDGIAVLTTEKSFCVKTGDSFSLAFGMIDGESGKLKDGWEKMSVVVSDPSVSSLSEYEVTEYGYSLEVNGKKKGSTNLVVTDTESGECITITISVYDEFAKTYSYDISGIASFYPKNKWEDHLATNIYNLNGLYINNYSSYVVGNKYKVSFDAYNHRYHTGAVDIYDSNGDWINSVAIEKYSDIASVWDTGEQLFYLISNVAKYIPGGEESNLLTYEQESIAKHTKVVIEVPEGGYFTISNNIKESPGAYLFNASELLFDAAVNFVDLSINGVEPSDFAKLVMNEITEDPTLRESFIETFGDTAVKEISSFAKNYITNSLEDGCTDLVNDYENLLNSLDIDWKHLASSVTGVAESVFTKISGPAGAVLSVYFSVMDGSNKLHQVVHMAKSIDEAYATVYSNIDSGMINPHGVYIDTNGNVDKETVLQVFRVSNDDTIEVVLDSDNPLEKYELYNISFIKNDKQVQPNGKVKVHIPIPKGMKSNTCKIYRQESNGTWTILNAHVEGNFLVFETDHFSLYAVIGETNNLTVYSLPNQLIYSAGDVLNTGGLKLKINNELITDGYICEPSVLSGVGRHKVIVKYGDSSTSFEVEVKDNVAPKPPVNDNKAGVIIDGTLYNVDVGDTIVYDIYLCVDRSFVDVQATITYDEAKLSVIPASDDSKEECNISCPNLNGTILNTGIPGVIKFNSTGIKRNQFIEEKLFATFKFTVIESGYSQIDLCIEEMGCYFSNGVPVVTEGIEIKEVLSVFEPALIGDANGDGKVNVKDATEIQKAVAGLLMLDETEDLAADVDESGKVNVKDATAIQKWVAGIETGFLIGEPVKN